MITRIGNTPQQNQQVSFRSLHTKPKYVSPELKTLIDTVAERPGWKAALEPFAEIHMSVSGDTKNVMVHFNKEGEGGNVSKAAIPHPPVVHMQNINSLESAEELLGRVVAGAAGIYKGVVNAARRAISDF